MQNLPNKYRPRSLGEFVGDPQMVEEIKECIENGIPVLLVGPPGTGKTSLTYLLADTTGHHVVESNASDERRKSELKDLQSRLKMKTFVKTLYLLDEADGLENQDFLADIVKSSKHPVVLTANEKYKMSKKLQKVCKVFEVTIRPNQLGLVVKRMKEIAEKENLKVSYQGVTTDVRESINKVFYGSQGYKKDTNIFEKVGNIFKSKCVERVDIIWLLDNIHNFYIGKDLYDAVKVLMLYAKTDDENVLGCLPKSKYGKAKYPYYLRKLNLNGHNK